MARRFLEKTLHTGRVAYLQARGLLELDFAVLVRPIDPRYQNVVAQWPFEDQAGLFYRVWQPSESMWLIAGDLFRDLYTSYPQIVEDDDIIWEAVRRIHRMASWTYPDTRQKGARVIGRVAQALSEREATVVLPVTLAAIAEIYRWLGGLVFPNPMAASISAATLLLMLGVPRERVAIFGMYYQDPTVYYRPNSNWRAGFLSGTPYYTVMGIFVWGRWVPVDFTLLADTPRAQLPPTPQAHLRPAELGYYQDGAPLVIDYRHPYTMVFAPPPPGGRRDSPLLSRIPLLPL